MSFFKIHRTPLRSQITTSSTLAGALGSLSTQPLLPSFHLQVPQQSGAVSQASVPGGSTLNVHQNRQQAFPIPYKMFFLHNVPHLAINIVSRGHPAFLRISFFYTKDNLEGVPLAKAQYGRDIRNQDARVFDLLPRLSPQGLSASIAVRIRWPGYEHIDWALRLALVDTDGSYLTVRRLIQEIAFLLRRFIDTHTNTPIRNSGIPVSNTRIQVGDLRLISLSSPINDGVNWNVELSFRADWLREPPS